MNDEHTTPHDRTAKTLKGGEVRIPIGPTTLAGELVVPKEAAGIVLFAHGSGSSRMSPRNQFVARQLQQRGLGTLLFDLLTRQEEAAEAHTRALRFDIALLANRLIAATDWVRGHGSAGHLALGFFGASTGAAAALVAAARLRDVVSAVVSRGGRPDLAEPHLANVRAPTLLIVGGDDHEVLGLNRFALRRLPQGKLVIVSGATHLFEEPGALEEVADLAGAWFLEHLGRLGIAATGKDTT